MNWSLATPLLITNSETFHSGIRVPQLLPLRFTAFHAGPSLVALALIALPIGCDVDSISAQKSRTMPTRPPLAVNVIRPTWVTDALKTEVCFGKLKPQRHNHLTFGLPGKVQTILKNEGDKCAIGEAIAKIDQSDLEQQQTQLKAQLTDAETKLEAVPPAAKAAFTKQIEQLKEQLGAVNAQLAGGSITAPYACIVTGRHIAEGAMVSPAVAAFHIIEDGQPVVETSLPQKTAAELTEGDVMWVGLGGTAVVSKLRSLTPIKNSANSQRLVLEFSKPLAPDTWTFGNIVEVRFFARSRSAGFWLPFSALQRDANGSWNVNVVSKRAHVNDVNRVLRKIVEVTQLENEFALVEGAITSEDRVIINGGHRIVPGQEVTAVDVSQAFRPPFYQEAAQ